MENWGPYQLYNRALNRCPFPEHLLRPAVDGGPALIRPTAYSLTCDRFWQFNVNSLSACAACGWTSGSHGMYACPDYATWACGPCAANFTQMTRIHHPEFEEEPERGAEDAFESMGALVE